MLQGTGMTALRSDGDVLINGSVTIESIDACAVRGNLSIVNAKNVTITASASKTASNKASCDTIDGDAYIEAGGSITLKNMLSGACVNGSLRAQGHSLTINNSSADKPALTSDRDHILTTDTLTLHNNSGPAAQGDLCINVYSEKANITGRYDIPAFLRMEKLWSAAMSTRRAAGSALPIPGQAEAKIRPLARFWPAA